MNKDLEKAIWWMLKEIEAKLPDEQSGYILFTYKKQTEDTPTRDDQRRALEWLAKNNAISSSVSYYSGMLPTLKMMRSDPPDGFYLTIIEDKIQEITFDFIKKFNPKKSEKINLPFGTKWENLSIKFRDGHNVDIFLGNKLIAKTDYKKMGFENKKTRNPNIQWDMLRILSSVNGELSFDGAKVITNGKKRKQYLSDSLKDYFGINSDPFYSYKKEKSYRIKINLIPENKSISRAIDNKNTEDEDMKSYYDEITTSIG